MVAISVTPCSGVDPITLYQKIKDETMQFASENGSTSNLSWDKEAKIDGNKIYASFTINLEADFDEEVMEIIEMMEEEFVENSQVTFQSAME